MDVLLTSRTAQANGRLRNKTSLAPRLRLARPNLIYNRGHLAPELGSPTGFLCQLYDQANAAGKNLVVFLHGGCSGLRQSLRRFSGIRKALADHNVHSTIGVSWPSNCTDYCNLVANAQRTGTMLGTTLQPFFDHIGRIPIERRRAQVHIIAHSMGGQVLEQMLATLQVTPDHADTLNQVVLGAPDITSHAFRGDGPLSKLRTLAQRIHVYSGWNDAIVGTTGVVACRWYPRYTRMGRVGVHEQHRTPPIHEVIVRRGFGLHWAFCNYPYVRRDWSQVLKGTCASEIPGRVRVNDQTYRL
ncbi:MAG: alpha/beta hydrolase [Nannocystaceae bacterium]